jgi:hypothetical protein
MLEVHHWRPSVFVNDYFTLDGNYAGHEYIIDLAGIEYGPIIVTPRDMGAGPIVRCPVCRQDLQVDRSQLGTVVRCVTTGCAGLLRVNPFIIKSLSAHEEHTEGTDTPC